MELFDTQAIDDAGLCYISRAHHVSDTSWSSSFGSRNTLDHEQNETLLAPSLGSKRLDLSEVIRTMPFNAQLASGTLSDARFKHYITQDAHYLIGFGRALTQQLEKYRHELAEAREQQMATSEVLKVISSSPGDLKPLK